MRYFRHFQAVLLAIGVAAFFSGCGANGGGAFLFDPINQTREYTPRQVDWNRAPLSVIKRSAQLDLELQEAQRRYDATRNAGRDDARAAAEYDFEHRLPRGANAPSFFCAEEREAYNQRFDSLLSEYRSKLEQGARKLGELEFYQSRQPR